MRVAIAADLCEAHGVCVLHAPAVFRIGDDEVAVLRSPTVDQDQVAATRTAVLLCPRSALTLIP